MNTDLDHALAVIYTPIGESSSDNELEEHYVKLGELPTGELSVDQIMDLYNAQDCIQEILKDRDRRLLLQESTAPIDYQRKWTNLRARMSIPTALFQEIPQEEIADMYVTARALRDALADGDWEVSPLEEELITNTYLAISGRHSYFQHRQNLPFGLGRWKNPL